MLTTLFKAAILEPSCVSRTTKKKVSSIDNKDTIERLPADNIRAADQPDPAWSVREQLSRIETLNHDQKWQVLKQISNVEHQVVKTGLLLSVARRIHQFSWAQIVYCESLINEAFFASGDDSTRLLLCDALATVRRSTGSIDVGVHTYHPALLHGLAAADTRFYRAIGRGSVKLQS